MPKIRIGLIVLILVGAAAAAGCGSHTAARTHTKPRTTARPGTQLPTTPAGRQLAWLMAKLNAHESPTTAEISAHFTPAFLKAVPPASLVSTLEPIASNQPFQYGRSAPASTSEHLVARVDGANGMSLLISITVKHETPHLISGLLIRPTTSPKLASWKGIDTVLAKLAARPSMLAAEVRDGRLQTVHALYPDRAGAIGSAFKLYVLGALGEAIDAGKASWSEEFAIRNSWKSIPSGEMQNEPAGKRFTLRRYAGQMIAISDNTAADHLIGRLGRGAVEKELVRLGNHSAKRNVPLLTTREMAVLKLNAPASLRKIYTQAGSAERQRLLARVDAIPLAWKGAGVWTSPRAIDTIEWFASPSDLNRAMVGLARLSHTPRSAPIRSILSKNPGVSVDTKVWRYVGYKGGSEPGVLSLAFYLERRDGRVFVLSMVLNDYAHDIGQLSSINTVTAAIGLLARS